MRWLRILLQRFRAATNRRGLDADLARELTFHLDQLAAEYEADGLPPDEAHRAARRALGNLPLVAEQSRDQRRMTWLHDFRQDVVYGARMLLRNGRVTTVIVASLALGIGANTAVLGVMDVVLREPLHVPDADRVVVARTFHESRPQQLSLALISDYYAWRERQRSFAALGVAFGNQSDFAADAYGPAERIQGQAVSPELFTALGVPPRLGRVFVEADWREGTNPIVLSHRLWQRRFGGAEGIIGAPLQLNGAAAVVVGVMPEGFHYPNEGVDFWVRLRLQPAGITQRFYSVVGRLRDGVTAEQAAADLNRIAAQLATDRPDRHRGWRVHVTSIRDAMLGWSHQPLLTLAVAVGLVLLVACTNVAGLLLARSVARRPEIAMRAALGASRGRLARQLLAESLLMSLAGGILGFFVAWPGVRALLAMTPPPGGVGILDAGLTARVVALSGLLAIGTGFLFGMLPAVSGSRSVAGTRGQGANESSERPWLREGLVAAQIAITFVLLIGAGLLTKTFVQLMSRDLRFDPTNLLTFELHNRPQEYLRPRPIVNGGAPYLDIRPGAAQKLLRVRDALAEVPGVNAVAGISSPLVNSVVLPTIAIAPAMSHGSGEAGPSDGFPIEARYFVVTPRFFTDVRASLRGRDIADTDTVSSPWVAIVNESAARLLWPDGDAVGRRVRLPDVLEAPTREVIGVVRDIPLNLKHTDATPVIYASYLQQPATFPQAGAGVFGRMHFILRTAGDPVSVIPAVRRAVAAVDPDHPMAGLATMDERLESNVPQLDSLVLVIVAFALTAALLAALGIYSVVAYAAARRTREIGIRIALGARTREIVALVSRRALVFVSAGLAFGLAVALAATGLLESQLWGVSRTDPATFAGTVVLLALVAAAACFVPTRRAVMLNPTVALREP